MLKRGMVYLQCNKSYIIHSPASIKDIYQVKSPPIQGENKHAIIVKKSAICSLSHNDERRSSDNPKKYLFL